MSKGPRLRMELFRISSHPCYSQDKRQIPNLCARPLEKSLIQTCLGWSEPDPTLPVAELELTDCLCLVCDTLCQVCSLLEVLHVGSDPALLQRSSAEAGKLSAISCCIGHDTVAQSSCKARPSRPWSSHSEPMQRHNTACPPCSNEGQCSLCRLLVGHISSPVCKSDKVVLAS